METKRVLKTQMCVIRPQCVKTCIGHEIYLFYSFYSTYSTSISIYHVISECEATVAKKRVTCLRHTSLNFLFSDFNWTLKNSKTITWNFTTTHSVTFYTVPCFQPRQRIDFNMCSIFMRKCLELFCSSFVPYPSENKLWWNTHKCINRFGVLQSATL